VGTTILEQKTASIFKAENASYIQKKEAVVSFETWVTISHTIHRHIVGDRNLVLIYQLRFFYRCTVHFEDSSIITHQQMHQYCWVWQQAATPITQYTLVLQIILPVILARRTSAP
jgi:hypothetical protein